MEDVVRLQELFAKETYSVQSKAAMKKILERNNEVGETKSPANFLQRQAKFWEGNR